MKLKGFSVDRGWFFFVFGIERLSNTNESRSEAGFRWRRFTLNRVGPVFPRSAEFSPHGLREHPFWAKLASTGKLSLSPKVFAFIN